MTAPLSSTTLLLSEFDIFQLQHPLEVSRVGHEEMGGQHLLNHGAYTRQGQMGLATAPPLVLQKAVGEGGQDHVALPAGQAAAFEMIESELVLEFEVLLLDSPALMGEADQGAERSCGRELHQVVAGAAPARQVPFAEQPDLGGEPPVFAPVVGW